MPIAVKCSCGRALRLKDELAGKKIRCPECDGIVKVPAADDESPRQSVRVGTPPPLKKKPPPVDDEDDDRPIRKRRPRDDDDDDEDERPARRSRAADDEDDDDRPARRDRDDEDEEEVERPKKKKKKKKRYSSESDSGFSTATAGLFGGLLMMVGAAVWFFLGLKADRIFIYPPILFVMGIAAVINGIFNRE